MNGFKKILLRPYPGGGLDYAGAEYQSIHGLIKSRWQRQGNSLTYDITVPTNTSASVYVPSDPETPIQESGKPIEETVNIKSLGRVGQFAVFSVPSGYYQFKSTYSNTTKERE